LFLITITAGGAALKVPIRPGSEAGGLNVLAGSPTASDFRASSQWTSSHLTSAKPTLPFSFTEDNARSAELLRSWHFTSNTRKPEASKTERTLVWTDPRTILTVRCVAVEYQDFPAVEWTVRFRNTGTTPTRILANMQALDAEFQRERDGEFVLHGIKGDSCSPDSYQPYDLTLVPSSRHRFTPAGGRPTNGQFPYYNLRRPVGGVLLAVGWPWQWAVSFTRDATNGLRIVAGQELTRLTLKAGEEIRTPLVAMLFWQGDDQLQAQNLWRRWMMAHNLPRTADGKPPAPICIFCSGAFLPGLKVSESSEKRFIDILSRERIKIDHWWMDAGWYPCGEEWVNTGNWEPDPTRFPNGLRAVSDYAHAKGLKLITWFERERVGDPKSWLAKNHPDWLLNGRLLNLGNPAYSTGNQGHTYGLSLWLPYYGQGVYQSSQDLTYYVPSHLCPSFGFCVDVRKPGIDWELYRPLADQWREVAPCMLGDYYPLTDYSLGLDQWIAWQFDRPDQGDGMVQAFRRAGAEAPTMVLRLRGLDPTAQYQVTNSDVTGSTKASGKRLMSEGRTVQLRKAPGAAGVSYRVAKQMVVGESR
jgi:hypothetical protein